MVSISPLGDGDISCPSRQMMVRMDREVGWENLCWCCLALRGCNSNTVYCAETSALILIDKNISSKVISILYP